MTSESLARTRSNQGALVPLRTIPPPSLSNAANASHRSSGIGGPETDCENLPGAHCDLEVDHHHHGEVHGAADLKDVGLTPVRVVGIGGKHRHQENRKCVPRTLQSEGRAVSNTQQHDASNCLGLRDTIEQQSNHTMKHAKQRLQLHN
jgi:hypothetical protein